MTLVIMALCCLAPGAQDMDEIREKLKDPAQVFPLFVDLIRAGRYSNAYDLLSGPTRAQMPYEVFYSALTVPEMSYDVSRRLLGSLKTHKADADAKTVEICGAEFGFRRTLRLGKLGKLWVLDFNREELESFVRYFVGRAMAWHRLQVKRADGWHYAYPPDWTYAPMARTCVCGSGK